MKKLYIEEPRLDDGRFVAYGKTDEDESCKVVWAFKDEFLNPTPETFIPDDMQMLADWENPTDVYVNDELYSGKVEMVVE